MHADDVAAGDPERIAARLAEEFASRHGREPLGCFAAPGRVNLIGEHIDYNLGRCLPFALPHATYAAVARRDDSAITVASLQMDGAWRGGLGDLRPGSVDGWVAYVAGVAWAMREAGIDVPGVDLVVDSRVPVGAGLSSSAALECSVALALCAAAGVEVTEEVRRILLPACIRAETDMVGVPTGGLDQSVSLFATTGHALLVDFLDGSMRQVPWDPTAHGLDLLVVDTRAEHSLAESGYEDRRRACEEAAGLLGVESLRHVEDRDGALARLPERLRPRIRHVFSEMARVDEAVRQLEADDYAALGRTLLAGHESLRADYEVSCDELDLVVDTARQHGALGARMTGGGFGGSAIALVPAAETEAVAAAVTEAFAAKGWRAPQVLRAPASDGARRVR